MHFTVPQGQISRGVQVVNRAVSSRASMPILNYILIEAMANMIRLAATDLELGIEVKIPAVVSEEGAVALPARLLAEIVTNLSESDVNVTVPVGEYRAFIECEAARFEVYGLPATDFPILSVLGSGTVARVDAAVFRAMIRQTSFAVSSDESRPFLTGVFVVIRENRIQLVATDGGRLALRWAELAAPITGSFSAIVPAKTMVEVMRVLGSVDGEVVIAAQENQVVFDVADIRVTSRLVAGQFPNYEQVIPRHAKQRIRVGTERLLRAVRRASITARDSANVVRLNTHGGVMTVTSNTPEVGKTQEEVAVDAEGESVEVAFNAKFLLDVLVNLDAPGLVLELTGPLSPAALRPEERQDYVYVLAPVRVYA